MNFKLNSFQFIELVNFLYFLKFKLLDTNGDEKLDKDEFLSFTTGSLFDVKNNDELKRFFRAFDSQNTGFISEIELKLVMEVFGVPVTDEDIKEAIKMADTNGDGKINYDGSKEFFIQHFI